MQFNPRGLVEHHIVNLPVVVISLYLMFSPVWSPVVASRMYDNSRVLELVMLAILAATLLLPKIDFATVYVWQGLGRTTQRLILIFLAGGVLSVAASGAPQVGALQM